ncbi:MAG TPA: DeoR/GlpR family DNA-binding transcription regulator [Candidatus Udaeobacter sp.]|nr:DeoR/GlpR family DNA-binding transcription regulator [Candidatus Udaeobacter sp.]
MAAGKKLKKTERQARILGELRAQPAIRISDLAGDFGVSTETIRRDLDELGQQGMLSRTYGGATARPFGAEPTLSERYKEHVEERERVGSLAARIIKPGQVLMVDAGSTTLHFARRLSAELRNLTVITNSFGVASALSTNPTISVVVCPGRYDAREGSVFGPDSESFLRRFNANVAVCSCSGLTPEGPNDVNPSAAVVKRAMMARAETNMLLVDHSKFGVLTLENVCPLHDIRLIVADRLPAGDLARAIRRLNLPVETGSQAPARRP